MGYTDGDEGSAVEQFMRHYYIAAKVILTACDAIVDRALEPRTRPAGARCRPRRP